MTDRVLLDVNVLVALSWDSHVHHRAAHREFARLSAWCTTPVTESGLLRLSLTPALTGRPVRPTEALGQLAAIRRVRGWSFLDDDASLAEPVIDVRTLGGRRQVTDLHLVNLAAANGARLATFDAAIPESLAPDDRRHVDVWHA